jgi:UDP-N-acetylmuramyl pentapeptide synthase
MCPHEMPDGVTFISDNWKASLWTVPSTLDFMKKANADRKMMVVGSISDTPKGFYHRYKTVIQQGADIFDKILFVGDHSRSALRARAQPEDDRIMAFETLYELNCFLDTYLRAGDLVLLKGTENADHLQRIIFARTRDIACWRQNCGKRRFCTECPQLHIPSEPAADTPGDGRLD